MIPTSDERFTLKLYKRIENSAYEWEEAPAVIFRGRPANQIEIRNYRIQQGVNGNTDSVFIKASNLPADLKPYDRIEFMGKFWTVMSTGYYYDSARFVNPGAFSNEYIASRCPKGINLQ